MRQVSNTKASALGNNVFNSEMTHHAAAYEPVCLNKVVTELLSLALSFYFHLYLYQLCTLSVNIAMNRLHLRTAKCFPNHLNGFFFFICEYFPFEFQMTLGIFICDNFDFVQLL